MKRFTLICMALILLISCVACGKEEKQQVQMDLSQMQAICELAVMDCYYHNVAKFMEENASQFLFFSKDKRFWIEYGSIVKVGIDAKLLKMDVKENKVTITLPKATVIDCKVDERTLTKESFIVDSQSAKITAEDERKAFESAQETIKNLAMKDASLLQSAQDRVEKLLTEYVNNIGEMIGQEYEIKWVYVDEEGKRL